MIETEVAEQRPQRCLIRGFELATVSSDIRMFVGAVQQELKAVRGAQKRDAVCTASAY
jgi:hypothetical protein